MSLYDDYLADPEPLTYSEWLRRRTVPAGLLTLPTPEETRQERAKVDRKLAESKPRTPGKPRKSRANPNGQPRVHGSTHAYKRHIAEGEDPCPECVTGHEAEKARRAADKRKARASKRREPAKHGTPQRARKHRRDGEEVCEECKEGERAEWRRRSKAERDEKRAGVNHNTALKESA